jgi:hypothetical protein
LVLVLFLAGEWVFAWAGMSLAFLVAAAGVSGLGWWVLRGDARNRAAEDAELDQDGPTGQH